MKPPRPQSGMKRMWYRCKVCSTRAYRDYIPYSISNPIIFARCGHSFEHDYEKLSKWKRNSERKK